MIFIFFYRNLPQKPFSGASWLGAAMAFPRHPVTPDEKVVGSPKTYQIYLKHLALRATWMILVESRGLFTTIIPLINKAFFLRPY